MIISLGLVIFMILSFQFYTFSQTSNLKRYSDLEIITPIELQQLEVEISSLSQVSFYFLAVTILLVSGVLIYLVILVSVSLKAILAGIQAVNEGDLTYRINLNSNNEFGSIAQFFNTAATSVEKVVDERTKQLQAERNKLAVILSGIKDSVIALDLERKIVTFNKNASILTGLSEQEVLGKRIEQVFSLSDNTQQIPLLSYIPDLRPNFEGILYQKDGLKLTTLGGKEAYVNITSFQILEGLSVNLGCILTIHDITTEQELEKMKLDFVSMAAHELRTPLTSINSYLYIFMKENSKNLNDEQNMFLNRINISTKQLMALVENLLNVSKIEQGVFKVTVEETNWPEYVNQTVNQFVSEANEKKIRLNFDKPVEDMPGVKVDKLRINEVLSNLISNALSYTATGGEVIVSVEWKGNEIVTHVKDSGQGIPEQAIPHLFTKFFRVAGKLSQGSKGTGLGLYISKAIVEAHHGRIWVESKLNVGSVFSFSIPVAS